MIDFNAYFSKYEQPKGNDTLGGYPVPAYAIPLVKNRKSWTETVIYDETLGGYRGVIEIMGGNEIFAVADKGDKPPDSFSALINALISRLRIERDRSSKTVSIDRLTKDISGKNFHQSDIAWDRWIVLAIKFLRGSEILIAPEFQIDGEFPFELVESKIPDGGFYPPNFNKEKVGDDVAEHYGVWKNEPDAMGKDSEPNKADPILCYVHDSSAYFTTQALADQSGEDWYKRPYEYNARPPWEPYEDDEFWSIIKIHFGGDYRQPCSGRASSPYSVEQINAGEVPWLDHTSLGDSEPATSIMAGTPLSEFKRIIWETGGEIFEKTPKPE